MEVWFGGSGPWVTFTERESRITACQSSTLTVAATAVPSGALGRKSALSKSSVPDLITSVVGRTVNEGGALMSRSRLRAIYMVKLLGAVSLVGGTGLVATLAVSEAGAAPSTPSVNSTAAMGQSGGISDSLTVVGNATGGAPTGNLTFYLCQTGTTQTLTPGACSNVPGDLFQTVRLTTGADDTSSASSASDDPISTGTWCFSAVYGGSTQYNSASDNTSGGNADPNECVLVTPVSSTSTSTISAADITLGPTGTVTDTVTVQGTTAKGSPTGMVTFYVCQTGPTQTLTPGFCSPGGTPEDTETLQAGASPTSSATSVSFTPTATGTWCFSAMYSGDDEYVGSSDNTNSGNLDTNECALVGQAGSTTSTTVSAGTVTVGPSGTVTDSVTVTGNSVGGAPEGSVDFYVCGPTGSDALCTSESNPEGTPTLSQATSDSSSAVSDSFAPSATGIWCFAALYVPAPGGNYTGSSDNMSGSVDPAECTVAQSAYRFTSADGFTATQRSRFSFQVSVVAPPGSPVPSIKRKGPLALGVRLINNGNGTATLFGTPRNAGAFSWSLYATWGKNKKKIVATQVFTLTVTS